VAVCLDLLTLGSPFSPHLITPTNNPGFLKMASLVEKLTGSGGTESVNFLNDIVEQLWPNINVAAGRMIKDIVEPILATTLPGPLANLRFTKIDLGSVPMSVSAVETHKVDNGGIKLDMDVTWEGMCDIELDGKMVPKLVRALLPKRPIFDSSMTKRTTGHRARSPKG
jgi:hypothetical protein